MKTALITSTGSVATDIVLKTLKKLGYRVVGCNIYPKEWIVDSCLVDVFYQIPPISDRENYLAAIKKVCLAENVKYVLPMIDYEIDLFNETKERTWFSQNGISLCISSQKTIDIVRDKKKLSDFVRDNCLEIQYIPTEYLANLSKSPWGFPVVCKPANGRSSQGLAFIHNEKEWEDFLKDTHSDNYIVEPFIAGPIVMAEVVRDGKTGKCAVMIRRELLSTPNGCSTTTYIYDDPKLSRNVQDLAGSLGIEGDVNFEFLQDANGIYHLVECNPRFSAGCEFSCIGGYDCVANHMRCFTGEDIEEYTFKESKVIARKYEEYVLATGLSMSRTEKTYWG